jgi:hypothetical protein
MKIFLVRLEFIPARWKDFCRGPSAFFSTRGCLDDRHESLSRKNEGAAA